MDDRERAMRRAAELGLEYLAGVAERHVGPRADAASIRERLPADLPDGPMDPVAVVDELATALDPGIVASNGPRYFGFVVGGALPAAAAADWLTGAWNQNAVVHALSPAAAAAEEAAGAWMLELLNLPRNASGWDVEAQGLFGAPEITVVIGEEGHATLLTALQYLGLGRDRVVRVPTDDQGQMMADEARSAIGAADSPLIVAAQAGNVNTGGFDPVGEIAAALEGHPNSWLHVDGAFGLWAAVSPSLAHLLDGVDRADSWSTDAHKWLNVGYDCGFVAVRDAAAHRAAMSMAASYLMRSEQRENWEYVLDSSRRARGFALYAAIRSLGREGIRALVERCCSLASRMADRLREADGVEVLNDVVLNQVLVRFGDDDLTRDVISAVQADGNAWMGGTTWKGRAAMRISVSNWSTTQADADRTVEAILRAAAG
jgi:glutamate/tyrosine decarboxylase-like PLP-dependent enzyme